MSIIDTDALAEMSAAPHDECAANHAEILAATASSSAQVLSRLRNPRAPEFAALARDLRLKAALLREPEQAGPHLRLVR